MNRARSREGGGAGWLRTGAPCDPGGVRQWPEVQAERLADLPDPEDTAAAWCDGEPAFRTLYAQGELIQFCIAGRAWRLVEVARQSAIQQRLRNEGRAGVKQHGQLVLRGIFPQRREPFVLRHEAGVHRQVVRRGRQFLMPRVQFTLPAILRRIDRQEARQTRRILGDVLCDITVFDPEAAQPRLAPEDDRAGVVRGRGAISA